MIIWSLWSDIVGAVGNDWSNRAWADGSKPIIGCSRVLFDFLVAWCRLIALIHDLQGDVIILNKQQFAQVHTQQRLQPKIKQVNTMAAPWKYHLFRCHHVWGESGSAFLSKATNVRPWSLKSVNSGFALKTSRPSTTPW